MVSRVRKRAKGKRKTSALGKRNLPARGKDISHPLVVVQWLDACTISAPHKSEEINPTCILHTVGWVVKVDKPYLVLAGEYDRDDLEWRSITAIPASCILTIKVLDNSGVVRNKNQV